MLKRPCISRVLHSDHSQVIKLFMLGMVKRCAKPNVVMMVFYINIRGQKLEGQWRKLNVDVHKLLFQDQCKWVNILLSETKSEKGPLNSHL